MNVTRQGGDVGRHGVWSVALILTLALFLVPSASRAQPATHAQPGAPVQAPAPPALPDPTALAAQLTKLQAQIPATTSDDKLAALHTQAAQIQAQADRLTAARSADLTKVNQQLAELKKTRGRRDTIRKETRALTQQQAAADQQFNQARQLSANAARSIGSAAKF